MKKPPKRYLVMDTDLPGMVVGDARGVAYVVVANRAGKAGGLRRIRREEDLRTFKETGIVPRLSVTLEEWIENVPR